MSKIKLYDIFNEWQYEGVIWLIGDPHFCDDETKLIDKNWPKPEEQVKLINSKVGKKDTLIILGDVGDESWVRKLKGYKILITGNHDKGASAYKRKETYHKLEGKPDIKELKEKYPFFRDIIDLDGEYVAYCDNGLFDEVYNGPLFISDKILLSHEPVTLPFGYNIHGHCHNNETFIYRTCNNVSYNVCSDVIGHVPERLDKIIPNFKVKNIHRLTISNANNKICTINNHNCKGCLKDEEET